MWRGDCHSSPTLHFRTIDDASSPPQPSAESGKTPFLALIVIYCTFYVGLCIYLIYTRRSRHHSVGKQERQADYNREQ